MKVLFGLLEVNSDLITDNLPVKVSMQHAFLCLLAAVERVSIHVVFFPMSFVCYWLLACNKCQKLGSCRHIWQRGTNLNVAGRRFEEEFFKRMCVYLCVCLCMHTCAGVFSELSESRIV